MIESEPGYTSPGSGINDSFAGQLKRIFTAATLLLIAYLIAFLLHQYITGLLCVIFGYHPVISFNHIGNLPMDYHQWTLWRITIIFSSGPLLSLIIGFFLLDYFNSLTGKGTLLRYFVLGCVLCFLNLFFSFLLISPVAVENYSSNLYTGFSIVGAWWRMGRLIMIPLAFVAFTGSVLTGFFTGEMFMKFSFSRTLIDTVGGRRKVLLQLYVLPVLLIVPVVIFLSNDKSLLLHVAHLANMLLVAVGMLMGVENISKETRVYGKDILNTISVFWITLAGALIAVILFVLK